MKRKSIIRLMLPVLLALLLLSAFGKLAHGQTPEATVAPAPTPAQPPESEPAAPEEENILEGGVPTRTPVPTATPGLIREVVSEVAQRVGLDEISVLGISAGDWIDLGVSLLLVLAGYFVGTWVIRRLLPRLVRRTSTEFDDRLLAIVGPDIRWLVVIFVLQFAVNRLTFISPELKTFLRDAIFIALLAMVIRIIFQLIKFAEDWFTEQMVQVGRKEGLTPVIKLLVMLSRVFAVVVGVTVLLSHFGIDVTLLAATLGIGGLALSLGARSLVSDLVAGITILTDQRFRIGDRVEIEAIDTWGDVIDISLRTTRIRTPDNRMVIVPNTHIVENAVVNYSYPDPIYRYQTHVGVAYGTDVESTRRVIVDTVSQLEEVLPDRPVDALLIEMGDSAMNFRVRWWMGSYVDTRRILDRVHTGIEAAFAAAGIEIPFPQRDLHLQIVPETVGQLSQAFSGSEQPESNGPTNEMGAESSR